MNEERKLLIVPSPLDERDWRADAIYNFKSYIPQEKDLRTSLQAVRNQGSQGTCAAQSAACMKEWQESKDINYDEYFSPQFIYNLRKNQDTEGMYGRDVMRILYKIGVCSEADYQYGRIETSDDLMQKDQLIVDASNHKIKHYAQLNTIEGTKIAVCKNGPCLICFPVYNMGMKMWIPKHGSKMMGGHAMTLVGYTRDSFIIRNSWGENWGDSGYCYYPFSEWGSHWELWTTIDDESFKEEEPDEALEEPDDTEVTPKRGKICPFWF